VCLNLWLKSLRRSSLLRDGVDVFFDSHDFQISKSFQDKRFTSGTFF
jgi:hypothetical protein